MSLLQRPAPTAPHNLRACSSKLPAPTVSVAATCPAIRSSAYSSSLSTARVATAECSSERFSTTTWQAGLASSEKRPGLTTLVVFNTFYLQSCLDHVALSGTASLKHVTVPFPPINLDDKLPVVAGRLLMHALLYAHFVNGLSVPR